MNNNSPKRPLVNMDVCETRSEYFNLPKDTLQHILYNQIFDNGGVGYSDLSMDLKLNYELHIYVWRQWWVEYVEISCYLRYIHIYGKLCHGLMNRVHLPQLYKEHANTLSNRCTHHYACHLESHPRFVWSNIVGVYSGPCFTRLRKIKNISSRIEITQFWVDPLYDEDTYLQSWKTGP